VANSYYNFGGPFIPSTKVRSGQVNPEFAGVESGFDLLPSASDALTRGIAELGIDVQGGTVNEFDVAMPDTRLTNQEGDLVVFRATHTNDGPVVINVDTIGDIAAVEFDGSAFAGGEIVTGRVYEFRYDNANTQFVLSQSTDAANQAISAEDWAIRPEDDPVPVSSGGDGSTTFSALHWSAKSAQFGGGLDFAGDHDGTSGDPATPTTGNPLYRIITGAGVITGAGTVEIGDDIYWNGVDWNRINNQAQSATTQGTSADDPTAPGSFDAQFQWQNVNGAPLANVGFNTGQSFDLVNVVHGGGLRLRGENGAGSVETYLQGSPGAGTLLMFTGLQKFATAVAGVIINDSTTNDPTAGLGQSALINLRNGSFATVADFGFVAAGTALRIKSAVHGGEVEIRSEDNAGVDTLMASFDPEGEVAFFRDAGGTTLQFLTSNISGITIRGGFAGLATITGEQADGTDLWKVGQNGSFMELESEQDNSGIQFVTRDSSPVDHVAARFNPAGDAEIFHIGVSVVATLAAAAGGLSANNTLTGGGFERVLTASDLGGPVVQGTFTNSNAVDLVDTDVAVRIGAVDPDTDPHLEIGISAVASELAIQAKATDTTVAELEINRLGGTVRVGSQTAGVAGAVFLHHSNGVTSGAVIETGISGIILEGKSGSSTILDFHAVSANLAMRVVYNGANFQFEGFIDSEEVRFQSRNSASQVRQMLHLDPDDDVQLYHPGSNLIAFRTTATGADVRVDAAGDPSLTLTEDATISARFQHVASTDITILKNEIDSGHVQVRGEDSGSVDTLMAAFDPDGPSELYHDGLLRAYTGAVGWTLRGDGASSGNFTMEDTGVATIFHIDVTASEVQIRSFIDSNTVRFVGNDSGSAQRNMILMDPDADVKLYQVGVEVVHTLTAAAGGLEANNTLTGAGFERVLTVADRTNSSTYTRNAVIVNDRTLLASASATTINNNNVLAALIFDLQSAGIIQ
jgi:hypothetical protein